MYHDTVIAGTPVIDSAPTAGSNHAVSSGGVKSALDNKANQSDITSIIATGSTNTTGATIGAGLYFYLNGAMVKAITDIAVGAAFTENTNYEAVTAGAINAFLLGSRQQIVTMTASTNLNNCTVQNTLYQIAGAEVPINAPASNAYNAGSWFEPFYLGSDGSVVYATQYYVSYNQNKMWYRQYEVGPSWKAWVQI